MFSKNRDEHSRTKEAVFRHIGERIRTACNERSMSQHDLADFLYKTGKVVSDIERGRVHVSLFDLSLIAKALDKPISYFFPPFLTEGSENDLTPDERELVLFYRKIWDDKLRAIALQQVRSIAEADTQSYLDQTQKDYDEFTQSRKLQDSE